MKIVVTGGAGFIGSHVVDRYLADGHEVSVIDDLSAGDETNLADGVRLYRIKIETSDIGGVLAVERPEVVNHHAAQVSVPFSVKDPCADALANILGTVNLLEACRRHGVKKIIFSSSGGAVYGMQEFFPATEDHPARPLHPYGISKAAAENYLAYYRRVHGIDFTALRYANVYGPRQKARGEAGVVAKFADLLLRGEPVTINGDGLQTRDFVYVGDVAECNARALDETYSGIMNVGTGSETSINALLTTLSNSLKVTAKINRAPEIAGETRRSCLKPGRIQEGRITRLEEGLQRTADWFRNRLATSPS